MLGVVRDDVSANEALADGCTRTRIDSAENVGGVIALSIEAVDSGAVSAQHHTVTVSNRATAGAQVRDDHFRCIQFAV